jgi:hypothetical protein
VLGRRDGRAIGGTRACHALRMPLCDCVGGGKEWAVGAPEAGSRAGSWAAAGARSARGRAAGRARSPRWARPRGRSPRPAARGPKRRAQRAARHQRSAACRRAPPCRDPQGQRPRNLMRGPRARLPPAPAHLLHGPRVQPLPEQRRQPSRTQRRTRRLQPRGHRRGPLRTGLAAARSAPAVTARQAEGPRVLVRRRRLALVRLAQRPRRHPGAHAAGEVGQVGALEFRCPGGLRRGPGGRRRGTAKLQSATT